MTGLCECGCGEATSLATQQRAEAAERERDALREALERIALNVPAAWGGEHAPEQIQRYARAALGSER